MSRFHLLLFTVRHSQLIFASNLVVVNAEEDAISIVVEFRSFQNTFHEIETFIAPSLFFSLMTSHISTVHMNIF